MEDALAQRADPSSRRRYPAEIATRNRKILPNQRRGRRIGPSKILGSARSLRIGVEHGDPDHVGRARRAKRNTRNDNDAVLRFCKAFASGQLAGALRHVVEVMRVLGDDRMNAPNKSETAGRLPVWREGENRRFGPLPGDAKRGRAGKRPGDNRLQIERFGEISRSDGDRDRVGIRCFGGARWALMILR
jgi:hypothetical protein